MSNPKVSQTTINEQLLANASECFKIRDAEHLYVNLSTFWYMFHALITSIGLVVSLISNMIIIYLFTRTPSLRRNPSNIIAVNLSLSDLLYCVQFPSIIYCSLTQSTWILNIDYVCRGFGFLSVSTALATILTILAMSVERAIVISSPIHARRRLSNRNAWFITIIIWIISLLSCLPPLFGKFNNFTLDPSKTSCTLDYQSTIFEHRLYIVMLFVLFWLVPGVIISISYMLIIRTFRKSSLSLRELEDAAARSETRPPSPVSIMLQLEPKPSRPFGRIVARNLRDTIRLKSLKAKRFQRNEPQSSIECDSGIHNEPEGECFSDHKRIRYLADRASHSITSSIERTVIKTDSIPEIPIMQDPRRPTLITSYSNASEFSEDVLDTSNIGKGYDFDKRDNSTKRLDRCASFRSNPNPRNSRTVMQFRLAKMSFYLILLWFVSWTPISLLAVINSVMTCHKATATGVFVANTMTKLGPAFDVFVYGLSHPKIKSKFKSIFKWLLMLGNKPIMIRSNTMVSSEYNTRDSLR